jgi:hypothetical protein
MHVIIYLQLRASLIPVSKNFIVANYYYFNKTIRLDSTDSPACKL